MRRLLLCRVQICPLSGGVSCAFLLQFEGLAMLIGVPKEIKNHEYRVGMTPGSVRECVHHGHSVIVETNVGTGIGAKDAAMTILIPDQRSH